MPALEYFFTAAWRYLDPFIGKMLPPSRLDRISVHRAVIAILVMLQSCSRLSRKGKLPASCLLEVS